MFTRNMFAPTKPPPNCSDNIYTVLMCTVLMCVLLLLIALCPLCCVNTDQLSISSLVFRNQNHLISLVMQNSRVALWDRNTYWSFTPLYRHYPVLTDVLWSFTRIIKWTNKSLDVMQNSSCMWKVMQQIHLKVKYNYAYKSITLIIYSVRLLACMCVWNFYWSVVRFTSLISLYVC